MNRRGFLGSILAAGYAPAAISSGVLMPLGKVWVPNQRMTATEVYERQQEWLESVRDQIWAEMQRAINPPMVQTPFGYVPMQFKGAPWFDLVLDAERQPQPKPSRTAQEISLMKRAADQRMHGIHARFRDEILRQPNADKHQ